MIRCGPSFSARVQGPTRSASAEVLPPCHNRSARLPPCRLTRDASRSVFGLLTAPWQHYTVPNTSFQVTQQPSPCTLGHTRTSLILYSIKCWTTKSKPASLLAVYKYDASRQLQRRLPTLKLSCVSSLRMSLPVGPSSIHSVDALAIITSGSRSRPPFSHSLTHPKDSTSNTASSESLSSEPQPSLPCFLGHLSSRLSMASLICDDACIQR